VAILLVAGSLAIPGLADGGPNHQVRNLHFGVSGGNVNDSSRRFCCSGTLGSLLTDGTTQYILSNNHVLARSDQASPGEDISQPGLIDNNCQIPPIVADFTVASPLGSNVDAAIAQLRTGQMDPTGFIEDVGIPASAVQSPSVGLSVAKSGRTTGFTTATISSINTSVNVQYQASCGQGKKFVVSYTDQVVINSSTFSAGGDSGSLIVSNAGHNPVALLFAGSSTTTIGNPAGPVLSALSTSLGRTLTFVGIGAPIAPIQNLKSEMQPLVRGVGGDMQQLPQRAADRARAVLEVHRNNLMATPGVVGAGVGAAADNDAEGAIVVYVDKTASFRPQFGAALDGVKVKVVFTDPFVAF